MNVRPPVSVRIRVLQDIRHRNPKLGWSLRKDQTSFEQKRPQLFDDCRTREMTCQLRGPNPENWRKSSDILLPALSGF
jgi:hypothetical protein